MRRQELKEKRSSFYEDWITKEGLRFWVSGRKIVTYSGPLDNIKTDGDNFLDNFLQQTKTAFKRLKT